MHNYSLMLWTLYTTYYFLKNKFEKMKIQNGVKFVFLQT